MHGVWNIILDDDFIRACTYGIVVMCIDGIERRVYPRIFTYSADYPEKYVPSVVISLTFISNSLLRVQLATIRDNGLFPCPRCLVSKSVLHLLGCPGDIAVRVEQARKVLSKLVTRARKLIYKDAKAINGKGVDDLLKEFSGVPTIVRCAPFIPYANIVDGLTECICRTARAEFRSFENAGC